MTRSLTSNGKTKKFWNYQSNAIISEGDTLNTLRELFADPGTGSGNSPGKDMALAI